MLDYSLLLLFLPTSFFISITPGLCMTLAMSLGMTIGLRRTFYMMWGELLGVATVATASILGVTTIMLNYPTAFVVFKWCGGIYLCYLGVNMWLSKGKLSLQSDSNSNHQYSNGHLFGQGFITTLINPKGWAFMVSLLPPFIDSELAIAPQLSALIFIMLCTELICMTLYASGGHTLKHLLANRGNVKIINRVSGSIMIALGIWLILG